MVRLVTVIIPKSKADIVLPLLLQLFEEEVIFQPHVQVQTCLNLPFVSLTTASSAVSNGESNTPQTTSLSHLEDGSSTEGSFVSSTKCKVDSTSTSLTLPNGSSSVPLTPITMMLLTTSIIYTITMKTKDKLLKDVLVSLEKIGIGRDYGQIDVLSLVLSKPAIATMYFGPGSPTSKAQTSNDVSDIATLNSEGLPLPIPSLSSRARNNSVDSATSNGYESSSIEGSISRREGGPLSIFITNRARGAGKGKDTAHTHHGGRKYRVSDRMTIEEIASFIDDGNHLTFNYLALLACASAIAGAGLLGDSATTVIASMLVSPLMGPILSITFGLAIQHPETIRKGIRNELIGILISFMTGLTIGIVGALVYPASYRSGEMVGRGTPSNLIYGFVVAFASGIAVILGITMGGVNALVGTAISASLLPPIVNSGMCMAMGILYHIEQSSAINGSMSSDSKDYYIYSGISFSLFAVNFVVIVIVGYCTFRYIKQVHPLPSIDKKDDGTHIQLV